MTRDEKFAVWRAAEELRHRNREAINARLSAVLGPVECEIREGSLREDKPLEWSARIRPPWQSEGAWFQEIEAKMVEVEGMGDALFMQVVGRVEITDETCAALAAGRLVIRLALVQFSAGAKALSVDPEWLAEQARRDADQRAAEDAQRAASEALEARRAAWKLVRVAGGSRIQGPGCDIECVSCDIGRWKWQAYLPGYLENGKASRPRGHTLKEVLRDVQLHFVPDPTK